MIMNKIFSGALTGAVVSRFLTDLSRDRDGTICKLLSIARDPPVVARSLIDNARSKLIDTYNIDYYKIYVEDGSVCILLKTSSDPESVLKGIISDIENLFRSKLNSVFDMYNIPKFSFSGSVIDGDIVFTIPVTDRILSCVGDMLPKEYRRDSNE